MRKGRAHTLLPKGGGVFGPAHPGERKINTKQIFLSGCFGLATVFFIPDCPNSGPFRKLSRNKKKGWKSLEAFIQ